MHRTVAFLLLLVIALVSPTTRQVLSLPVTSIRATDQATKDALEGPHGSFAASVAGSFWDNFDQGSLDQSRWITSGYWANVQPFNTGWDPAYWTMEGTVLVLLLKRIPFRRQEWDLPFTSGGAFICITDTLQILRVFIMFFAVEVVADLFTFLSTCIPQSCALHSSTALVASQCKWNNSFRINFRVLYPT